MRLNLRLAASNLPVSTLGIFLHEIPHMASAQQLPPAPGGSPRSAQPAAAAAKQSPSQALIPTQKLPDEEPGTVFSAQVQRLPVELDVAVPVRGFRVRHLLALEPGQLVESQWGSGVDLPLAAGDVRLAWTEFEVVATKLAVRVTRVA
jgi:flagellar motor switch/type III secretory pathway protein FliN